MRPVLALAMAAALFGGVPAKALPITGGVTEIEFSEDIKGLLGTLGITVATYGGASFDFDDFVGSFPVTGGTSASGGLAGSVILHEGSGVVLTQGASRTFEFGEFVVDTTTGVVTSSVFSTDPAVGDPLNIPGGSEAFFVGLNSVPDDDGDVRPFALTLSDKSATNFNNTFGVDAFEPGAGGITANITIEVVPVPAGLPLLATGLAALGFVARRRRAGAA